MPVGVKEQVSQFLSGLATFEYCMMSMIWCGSEQKGIVVLKV
jgi:hypothetical protein